MPHLIGPDFIGIQAEDLEAARTFYTEVVGLKVVANSPPGAVVFDTKPVPFAVRTPLVDLGNTDKLGWGVAIWFGCDDADALHDHLAEHGIKSSFEVVEIGGSSVGKVFEAYVGRNRIDLLVMGAYRHSRLNEIIWGGATKTVIGRPPCWVMMSR